MTYLVVKNFKNQKVFYKIGDSYSGSDAKLLLSQGLIQKIDSASELEVNGDYQMISPETVTIFPESPKKSKKKKE